MQSFFSRLFSVYESTRELVQSAAWRISSRTGATANFNSLHALSQAVFSGRVVIGDRVSGIGWFSVFTHWYVPSAYSPYQLRTVFIRDLNFDLRVEEGSISAGEDWAMQMVPSPAHFPTARIPFVRQESAASQGSALGFLYPIDTTGFNLQIPSLARPSGISSSGVSTNPSQARADQAWIINLDTGRGGVEPESWVHRMGNPEFYPYLQGLGIERSFVLTDPAAIRQHIVVPEQCLPIPILFPARYGVLAQKNVRFTARLCSLEDEVLRRLCHLGDPLTGKVYSLFWKPEMTLLPFGLSVEAADCTLEPLGAQQQGIGTLDNSKTGGSDGKLLTFLVESYFENLDSDAPVTVDDEKFVHWIVPALKGMEFTYAPTPVLPDRWAGKLFGFDGPIYFYKTGPIEFSINPAGFFSAHTTVPLNGNYAQRLLIFKDAVLNLRQRLIQGYHRYAGARIEARTTYLSDFGWKRDFGEVLDGREVQRAARESRIVAQLRQEIQGLHTSLHSGVHLPMRNVKILFVSSNPQIASQRPLRLDEEIRAIKQKIWEAEHRDLIEVETLEAARPDDLLSKLNRYEPDVIHFSGHGSQSQQLVFCDDSGQPHPVSKEALVALFEVMASKVQVAVFNACFSQSQAEAIVQTIPCTIGMNKAVGDKAATVFAAAFYRGIASGKSVQNAFDQGKVALMLQGNFQDKEAEKTPQLLVKVGVDASRLVLISPQSSNQNPS